MSRTWFTADLHLGHAMVATLRGFSSPEEHDAEVLNTWAALVAKDDIVWVLGDVALAGAAGALAQLRRLPGRKRLVAGNHDRVHPMHRNAHRAAELYAGAFEFVAPFARARVEGVSTLLSHFPYLGGGDRGSQERYSQWRLPDFGEPLLHGHTHSSRRNAKIGGRVTHVGWDAWGRPAQAEEVFRVSPDE